MNLKISRGSTFKYSIKVQLFNLDNIRAPN
jgi:hypothetical protein